MKLPSTITLPWVQTAKPPAVVGLAIEEDQLGVVVLRRTNGSVKLEQTLTLPITAQQILEDPVKAGRDLAAALQQHHIRERSCAVRVPPSWALTTSVDLPPASEEDLREFFQLRAEREFPFAPGDLALAHSRYELTPGKPRATLAAVQGKRVQAIRQMIETAGRRLVSVSLGLTACHARNGSISSGALHLWPHGRRLDMIITAGGGVITVRSLDLESEANDTAVDPASLSREIRLTLARLPEELRHQIKEVHWLGGSEDDRGLRKPSEEVLRGWGIQTFTQERPATHPQAEHLPAVCLPAVEVATSYLQQKPVHFEFLPPQVSRWQQWVQRYASGRGRQWAIGAGALVLLVILAGVIQSRRLAALEARWQAMAPEVQRLEALQRKIRQWQPWFENHPRTLQVALAMTEAFPEEGVVWAKTLSINDARTVTCTGQARSNSAFLEMLDALRKHPGVQDLKVQQVRGSNPLQFTIQFTWQHEAP